MNQNPDGSTSEPNIPDEDIRPCSCLACEGCKQPFLTYAINVLGRCLTPVKFCEACSAKNAAAEADAQRQRIEAAREARFNLICPPEYRGDEIRKAMPKAIAQQCRDIVAAGNGVLAIGASGKFKTTVLFSTIRFLIMRGERVEYLTAAKFRQRASKAAKECDGEAFVKGLAAAPWLFLDDLGNMNTNETAQETLHDLLEERMAQGGRPILATTQYAGQELIDLFTRRAAGEAIVRRLALLTKPVHF